MLDRHIHSNGMAANAGPSIQAAIDAVAQSGGGRVTLGAGVHRSTTIRLRSHVRLHLEAGCVLAALDDASGFPIVDQLPANPGHVRAMVFADGETGLTITGPGTIAAWGSEEVSWQQANAMPFRPALVYMRDCRQVRLDRLTLRDSVFWTCHLLRCRSVRIEQVTIRNRWPNSDGIDPDGCCDVAIRNCDIVAGDDCICLKSTQGDPCERITIRDCALSTSCAAMKLGTEALADIRDVSVERCRARVIGAGQGIALYLKDRGRYRNIRFADIHIDAPGSQYPAVVDVTPRDYRDATDLGAIRDVVFERVRIHSPGQFWVEGHPASHVHTVQFTDCVLRTAGPDGDPRQGKPVGSARGVLDPDRDRYAGLRGAFILVHTRGATFRNCRSSFDLDADSNHATRPLVATHDATYELDEQTRPHRTG